MQPFHYILILISGARSCPSWIILDRSGISNATQACVHMCTCAVRLYEMHNVKGVAKDGTENEYVQNDASVNIWDEQNLSIMLLQQMLLPDVHNEYEEDDTDTI